MFKKHYKPQWSLYNDGKTETLIVIFITEFETLIIFSHYLSPFPKTWAPDHNMKKHKFKNETN